MNPELVEANEMWSRGETQLQEGNKPQAEAILRESLLRYRNAFHLASEDPLIGQLLHQKGRLIHDCFNCKVRMEGQTYYEECPVILAHIPLGFSIGGTADVICSICGKDPWDCEHITEVKYNRIPAQKVSGLCNICLKEDCNHVIGDLYDNVEAIRLIVKCELDHVSLVDNPANPLARIHMYTLAAEEVRETLPDAEKSAFVPGKTVIHCHHCVECTGIK